MDNSRNQRRDPLATLFRAEVSWKAVTGWNVLTRALPVEIVETIWKYMRKIMRPALLDPKALAMDRRLVAKGKDIERYLNGTLSKHQQYY